MEEKYVNIPVMDKTNGITLMQIFKFIWNWKWILIIITFLVFLFVSIFGFIYNKNNEKIETIVEFQWDGIALGEYPNGQRFDYGSIFDSPIFVNVIDELDLDLTVDSLKSAITVNPIIPENIQELIENSILRGLTYTYYPTMFKISYDNSKIKLPDNQASLVLSP